MCIIIMNIYNIIQVQTRQFHVIVEKINQRSYGQLKTHTIKVKIINLKLSL